MMHPHLLALHVARVRIEGVAVVAAVVVAVFVAEGEVAGSKAKIPILRARVTLLKDPERMRVDGFSPRKNKLQFSRVKVSFIRRLPACHLSNNCFAQCIRCLFTMIY